LTCLVSVDISKIVPITRIIRPHSGHSFLLAIGGSGVESLTQFASNIAEHQIFNEKLQILMKQLNGYPISE
jgi:hypothetical protein